jgi:hypothetical protein
MANEGFPTTQPYSRAGLLAKLTGAATLAAGAMLYGAGTAQIATLATPAISGATRYALSHPGGAVAPSWSALTAWTDKANTFTAAQIINTTGSVSSRSNVQNLCIIGANLAIETYGSIGQNQYFCAEGTISSPAFPNANRGGGIAVNGWTAAATWTLAGGIDIITTEVWNAGANGTRIRFRGTQTGGTGAQEWGSWKGGASEPANMGALCIGGQPTTGNGLLQLAAGTTQAYSIGFGTDTWVGRAAAGTFKVFASTASTSTTTGALVVAGGVGVAGDLHVGTGIFTDGTAASAFGQLTGGTYNGNFGLYPIDAYPELRFRSGATLRARITADAQYGDLSIYVSTGRSLVVLDESAAIAYFAVAGSIINTGTTTGTKFGNASNQKLAFYGAAPLVQQTAAAAATDPSTTQTLANSLRTILLNLGLAA